MADSKITALTSIGASTDPANDPLVLVDVSDTSMAASGTTKKVTLNNLLACSPTATLASATITGDLTVKTNVLKVDTANNRVGIGTASPVVALDVNAPSSVIIGNSTTGTNQSFLVLTNTGGGTRCGIEGSGGGGLFTGSSAYASVLGSTGAYPLQFGTNLSIKHSIASDGVATWSNVGGVAGTAMTLNSTGLGVGVSPQTKIHIEGASATVASTLQIVGAATSTLLLGQNADGGVVRGQGGNNCLTFWTGGSASTAASGTGTERARIDASGNLLVGTTSSSFGVAVGLRTGDSAGRLELGSANSANANIGFDMYSTGAAAYRFYVGWGGTVFATNTTISAISDARFKENVQDIDVGLGAILALKPRKFDWKAGKGKDIKGDRGFIAQEFEQVFPNLIDEWKDAAPEGEVPYKSVRQDLIPVLVKAIQELTARVEALEA